MKNGGLCSPTLGKTTLEQMVMLSYIIITFKIIKIKSFIKCVLKIPHL